jgi:hypothetical protein
MCSYIPFEALNTTFTDPLHPMDSGMLCSYLAGIGGPQ